MIAIARKRLITLAGGASSRMVAVAILAVPMITTPAPAATVRFFFDIQGINQFTLYADVSDGDNGGLAFYSLPLLGTFTNLDHVAPLTVNGTNFSQAGFGVLRTGGVFSPTVNPTITGSQDVFFGPAQNLIYGFGQESSSFVSKGIVPLFSPDPTSDLAWGQTPIAPWFDHPIRLATGTYDSPFSRPTIDTSDLDFVANVFDEVGSRNVPAANVIFCENFFGPTCPIEVGDLDLGASQVGSVVSGGPLPADGDVEDIQWYLDSFSGGPGASVDANTGVFTWDSTGAAAGTYTATIRAANSFGGQDFGQLTFTLLIPEPASLTLLALALLLAAGFPRRR